MKTACEQKTLELAHSELTRFNGYAKLNVDPSLPSFEIRCTNGAVMISGPTAVDVLYGVYDFAERYLGYCFFEPGRDRFDAENIVYPLPEGVLVKARAPLMKNRGFIQEFPFDADTPALFDWMAKNKLNYLQTWMKYYDELTPELKEMAQIRGIEIESGHHNFDYWIPGKKYGKTHPEFFAEIKGKRINPSGGKGAFLLSEQLCTTNPALRKEMVRNILAYCKKNPEVRTVAVIPNDGFGWCECKECSAFYDRNRKGDLYSVSEHVYKASGIYHDLVRYVADQVHKTRPDINVAFCAYVNYCTPADGFTLDKGMVLHFAPYWRCINHTIDDIECPVNSRYARDIRDWAAVKNGGTLNIYEYYMGVNFYVSLPMIHFHEMFHEMHWYAENKVDGVLTQFHIPHWTVYGVNYYLMAKAAYGEDEHESVNGMLQKLFGRDASIAVRFYGKLKKLIRSAGHCHIPYPYSLLSRTTLESYDTVRSFALELAAKAPEDRFRRELVIWSEYLCRFKKLFDDYHKGEAGVAEIKAFRKWIHAYGDTRVFVHSKIDLLLDAWIDAVKAKKEWLHFNIDWEDEYIRKHRDLLGVSLDFYSLPLPPVRYTRP